jgi:hypothetical protein
MVVNEIRKNVGTAVGKLTPKAAQDLAKSLMPGQSSAQIAKAAQGIVDWSNRNRERISELVRAEVGSQLKQVGVASRDEVDALRRRVRELEKAQSGSRSSTAKRSRAKRSTPKRATARATKPEPAASATSVPTDRPLPETAPGAETVRVHVSSPAPETA